MAEHVGSLTKFDQVAAGAQLEEQEAYAVRFAFCCLCVRGLRSARAWRPCVRLATAIECSGSVSAGGAQASTSALWTGSFLCWSLACVICGCSCCPVHVASHPRPPVPAVGSAASLGTFCCPDDFEAVAVQPSAPPDAGCQLPGGWTGCDFVVDNSHPRRCRRRSKQSAPPVAALATRKVESLSPCRPRDAMLRHLAPQ